MSSSSKGATETCRRKISLGSVLDPASEPRAVFAGVLGLVHHAKQIGNPGRAVLDAHRLERGEAAEDVVEDQRRERVHDRSLPEHGALERGLLIGGGSTLLAEGLGEEIAVARLGTVEGDRHAGLRETCPEGVEVRVADRPAIHGREEHVHHAGPAREDRVELSQCRREIDQRDRGDGEDPMSIVEAPGLVDPAVEGAQIRHTGLGVIAQLPLDAEPEARPHHDGLDLLLVHPLEARIPIGEARDLARSQEILVLERSVAEILGRGVNARTAHQVGRTRLQIVGRLLTDMRHPEAATRPNDPAGAIRELRLEVSSEAIIRLVVVIVRVDDRIGMRHRCLHVDGMARSSLCVATPGLRADSSSSA